MTLMTMPESNRRLADRTRVLNRLDRALDLLLPVWEERPLQPLSNAIRQIIAAKLLFSDFRSATVPTKVTILSSVLLVSNISEENKQGRGASVALEESVNVQEDDTATESLPLATEEPTESDESPHLSRLLARLRRAVEEKEQEINTKEHAAGHGKVPTSPVVIPDTD